MLRDFGPFSPMFEHGADIAKGSISLTMKRIYHCMPNDIIVSKSPNDKGINMAVLSSKRLNNRVQLSYCLCGEKGLPSIHFSFSSFDFVF